MTRTAPDALRAVSDIPDAVHPPDPTGRPRGDPRRVKDGAIYRMRSGGPWHRPPGGFGSDTTGPRWLRRLAAGGVRGRNLPMLRCIAGNPFRPVIFAQAWRTPTVLAIAGGVYADRAFDRLPVRADAVEDAGCDHANLLAHLRGPEPHVRGCWPVDLILGKA